MSKVAANIQDISILERTTRLIRWLSIVTVLVTFPQDAPQVGYVYALLGVLSVYNITRYISPLYSFRAFRSPLLSLAVDSMFAGLLVALVGDISTPYSAFFVFMIVIAAYLYQMAGVVIVALIEAVILLEVVFNDIFAKVALGTPQTLIVTLFALMVFGFLISRLTMGDRKEKATLEKLRKKSEQDRSRLLTLVNNLNTAIIVTNHKGRIIQHNDAARILVGSTHSLDTKQLSEVMPLYRRADPKKRPIDAIKDAKLQHRRDLSITLPDDTTIDVDISITPVSVADKVGEFIIVAEDISRERSLDQQRTSFISVASHELRTPLAILEASLQTILTTVKDLKPQVRGLIQQAHNNTVHLAEIVNDLTVLAEAHNDNIPVNLGRVNPNQILTQCVADFAASAQQKGIVLKKIIEPKVPPIISTEHYIREILQNFITNALKYSEQGTITLRAALAQNGGVLFSVEDQGIGIAPGDQKMIFRKFFRAENYLTQSTGGTGLGLYLCMEVAERLGARIWFKSSPGKGSTFYLEVPPQSNLRRDEGEVIEAQVASLVDDL
jgi:signal transduction histidine kinase